MFYNSVFAYLTVSLSFLLSFFLRHILFIYLYTHSDLDYGNSSVRDAFKNGPLSDAVLNETIVQTVGKSQSTWQKWDFPSTKTRAYVFRGTWTKFDVMQDLGVYSMSSTMEFMSLFLIPLDRILPTSIIIDLVDLLTHDDFEVTMHLEALLDVQQWVASHPRDEGWNTVVLGHSLGGSYANLVGAIAQVPTFALSPPGLLQISKNAGVKDLELAKSFLPSLVPSGDPIAMVDEQVGTRVDIPCTVPIKYISGGMGCHSMHRTLSTLAMACPDWTYPQREWSIVSGKKWFMGSPNAITKDVVDSVALPNGWPKLKPKLN